MWSQWFWLGARMKGAGDMNENELAALVTRNGLIGTASR